MCLAVAGRVTGIRDEFATVQVREHAFEVGSSLRPEVGVGDYVVIQAGLIMDIISEEEARELEAYQREVEALFSAGPDT